VSWPALVYLLCMLASIVCLLLLARAYRRTRSTLLLWSAVCFVGLALNNLLLVVDLLVLPQYDLSIPRLVASFVGVTTLLAALVWGSER
jgi:hypothetical protein